MNFKNERLIMTEEEARNRAKELLNENQVDLLTKYMFLEQQCKKQKEVIDKAIEYIESKNNGHCIINGEEKGAFTFVLDFDEAREFIWELLDILKEVK